MEKVEKKQCKGCCRDIAEDDYNAYDEYCKFCYPDKEKTIYSKEQYNNGDYENMRYYSKKIKLQ